MGTPGARDRFVRVLAVMRERYEFALVGYVVMPEHVHLLIGEPKKKTPSVMLAALKQRVALELRRSPPVSTTGGAPTALPPGNLATSRAPASLLGHKLAARRVPTSRTSLISELPRFWMHRFYDFNVQSSEKRREKLDYMHANPAKRGLVTDPKDWVWSSYASYSGRGTSVVEINFVP